MIPSASAPTTGSTRRLGVRPAAHILTTWGFEIATFAVDGELDDRDEGLLRTGDVAFMTAGSGVVQNENVRPQGKAVFVARRYEDGIHHGPALTS